MTDLLPVTSFEPPHGGDPGGAGPQEPPPPSPRRRGLLVAGVLAVAAVVIAGGLYLRGGGPDGADPASRTGAGQQDPPAQALPVEVSVNPADGAKKIQPDAPIRITADNGRLLSVKVAPKGGEAIPGELAEDGSAWRSTGKLAPETRYTVTAKAQNDSGEPSTTKTSFTTLTPKATLGTSIMPLNGETVGVGMPIGVFFTAPVTDKAAVEKQLVVKSSSNVEGSWRWFGDKQVRWRPKEYWPAGEKVKLSVNLAGVNAGEGVWGKESREINFNVGDSHVSTVDVKNHSMVVKINGRTAKEIPVSTGRKEFPTTNGVHTVLEKNRHRVMDSATIGIPKSSPEYYRTEVEYAVRITNTGEFVHAAPWSEGQQGSANVSHGCVNVSMEHGAWFFGLARRGDVVEVVNSSRKPGETEGLLEWNRSFEEWKSGSALG